MRLKSASRSGFDRSMPMNSAPVPDGLGLISKVWAAVLSSMAFLRPPDCSGQPENLRADGDELGDQGRLGRLTPVRPSRYITAWTKRVGRPPRWCYFPELFSSSRGS